MINPNFLLSILVLACLANSTRAELAIGAGVATFRDPQIGMKTRQQALPLVSYTGERINFQVTTLSYRLINLGDVEVSALASARLQGYDANDSPYLTGMKDRSHTLDGGISLEWGRLSLAYTHDLLAKHKGDEIALSYTESFTAGKANLMISVGANWQSEKLNQYYYGVELAEAKNVTIDNQVFERAAHQVEEAISTEINMLMIYPLTNSWAFVGGAEVNFFPKEITDSPIMDNKYGWGAFAGLMRAF